MGAEAKAKVFVTNVTKDTSKDMGCGIYSYYKSDVK